MQQLCKVLIYYHITFKSYPTLYQSKINCYGLCTRRPAAMLSVHIVVSQILIPFTIMIVSDNFFF